MVIIFISLSTILTILTILTNLNPIIFLFILYSNFYPQFIYFLIPLNFLLFLYCYHLNYST